MSDMWNAQRPSYAPYTVMQSQRSHSLCREDSNSHKMLQILLFLWVCPTYRVRSSIPSASYLWVACLGSLHPRNWAQSQWGTYIIHIIQSPSSALAEVGVHHSHNNPCWSQSGGFSCIIQGTPKWHNLLLVQVLCRGVGKRSVLPCCDDLGELSPLSPWPPYSEPSRCDSQDPMSGNVTSASDCKGLFPPLSSDPPSSPVHCRAVTLSILLHGVSPLSMEFLLQVCFSSLLHFLHLSFIYFSWSKSVCLCSTFLPSGEMLFLNSRKQGWIDLE